MDPVNETAIGSHRIKKTINSRWKFCYFPSEDEDLSPIKLDSASIYYGSVRA